jgi:hypothetical protein
MAALAVLFGFLLLLGQDKGPVCPPLHSDRKPTEKTEIPWNDTGANFWTATSGDRYRAAKVVAEDGKHYMIQEVYKDVSTTTDPEAIAYNKRVEECRTKNGEF